MKTLILFFSILFFAPYAVSSGFDKQEVEQFSQICLDGAANHERRIFDALSNSEYINWTIIEVTKIESRVNYSETQLVDEDANKVVCDLVVEYSYNNKEIVLNSDYEVSTVNKLTISRVSDLEQAVTDFIVRVMVN